MIDRPAIVLAQPHLAAMAAAALGHYEVLPLWEDATAARLAEVRAIVVAGEYPLARDLVDRMPALELVACFTVGYDAIDTEWASGRGIVVTHAQDANQEDVADHAIGLIVGQRRRIVAGDRALRAGEWSSRAKTVTRSFGGARIGIVGLGGIGDAVARRAAAMRMQVAWWGPNPKPDAAWPRADDLLTLARDSDILVVACRATEANRGLISAAVIDALGPDGLLVNVARGQLVDEDALIAALQDGRLGGAALDVFATEPTPAARWADVPNTVLTPHTAGATDAAITEMTRQLVANLDAFFAGQPLVTVAA